MVSIRATRPSNCHLHSEQRTAHRAQRRAISTMLRAMDRLGEDLQNVRG